MCFANTVDRRNADLDSRFKGQIAMPSIGYGSNKKTRHMMVKMIVYLVTLDRLTLSLAKWTQSISRAGNTILSSPCK